VRAGGITDAGTISLTGGGVLTGRVVDEVRGDPLPGARIRSMIFGGFNSIAFTDGQGVFRLEDVPAERLSLEASKSGYLAEVRSGITPPAGGVRDVGTIRLQAIGDDRRGGFNYAGLGTQIRVDEGRLWIDKAFDGTPAAMAGLGAGTEILAVNGYLFSDLGMSRAVELIRGEAGTEVVLDILPPGASVPVTVRIERARVRAP
jgi:hypothetical protein